ncbi:hybrid sensor histidine kinase/response regulator [Undibacterium sp. TJN25]|uniref:hybrid sensor histidine kinase/response regulator n=1 Tax=Undibacterium sp. TJN25 TaxID=3413056 RepID=UPI003BF0CC4E
MTAPIPILVVDDTQQNLTAVEALLSRPDIVILKASSGAEALELLLVKEVALALIDVQMPNMDGFELAELIRGSERTRSIPLIFLTAATREPSYSFRGYEAGAVDFLFKPIDGKALISKVNVFVELYQQRKLLSSQLEELRHSLHLNEMFTAVLGHDLRTPLSVVMNGAMLLPMMTDHPKVKVTAGRIESSARRMAQMVDQLLDLARIRSGGLQLDQSVANYEELCRGMVEELHLSAKESRISLHSSGDVSGSVDACRFEQVIGNLLNNALQHGEPGQPVSLQIDGSDRDWIVLKVGNRGVIDAQQLPLIFKPFHQGSDRRNPSQGLGLGLYTVSKFIGAHGGTVEVDSTPEHGTVFTLRMPRRRTAVESVLAL